MRAKIKYLSLSYQAIKKIPLEIDNNINLKSSLQFKS